MSSLQRQILYAVLGALLIGGATWLWFELLEKRWAAVPQRSAAAQENPMLAATLLLGRHQHAVKIEPTLGTTLLKPLPRGTLILAENGGIVTPSQAEQLLAWVRQGNTLIARPKWKPYDASDDKDNETDDDEEEGGESTEDEKEAKSSPAVDVLETDPIGAYLGVVVDSEFPQDCDCKKKGSTFLPATAATAKKLKAVQLATVTLPKVGHPLQIDLARVRLQSTKTPKPALFSDEEAKAVRVYAEGKGHIALVANNYFNNYSLRHYDHAELLLGLAELNDASRDILIVQHLSVLPWYRALWENFQLALVSLACGLLLLFWAAIRRFGPLLPEPVHDRRALIEHIDASGRWLWKVPGGRDTLLATARASVNKLLLRRAPELQRLSPDEQIAQLAHTCGLARASLASALREPASKSPIEFTRQIKTLQHLRKHYER